MSGSARLWIAAAALVAAGPAPAAAQAGDGETGLLPGGPCRALSAPQRLFAQPIRVAVAAAGQGFLAAGYVAGRGREEVRLVVVPEQGPPRLLARVPVPVAHPRPRRSVPGLSARGGAVALATVDGRGVLRLHRLRLPVGRERRAGSSSKKDARPPRRSRQGPRRAASKARVRSVSLRQGVDTRFAPAVAEVEAGTLVAFTLGETPMRTLVSRVSRGSGPLETSDITPPHQGAAAPVFVAGKEPPWLVAVDPRDGLSTILRTRIPRVGGPQRATIAAPVGMVASPTQLAAASGPGGRVRVAYIGIGSAATTAVGLVVLDPASSPTPLVKGTAYGPLYAAAVATGSGVVFAADAPRAPGKQPDHELKLVHIDARGVVRTGTLRSADGDAFSPAMAINGTGVIGIAYTTRAATEFVHLRCE